VVIVPDRDEREPHLPVLSYVTFDTEIGRFIVSKSGSGLCAVRFAQDLDVERELQHLTRGRSVVAVEDRLSLRRVVDAIRDYLAGRKPRFDYRLDLDGVSDFGRRVLDVVREIPYGGLRSYKWVAREIGHSRATRPVGQALARNPLPIVIPCHRVVNSDGSLGGYSGGGTDMKRRLIAIETGQIGLPLRDGDDDTRRRIRFLLDSES
jgi:methylated-DNA-[protein]-cysteine S-methyltransferase